ncbi:MAG: quinol:cytochrome C oxidoreductase [Myxococcaceae bacterium]|nr:quinol:cytochrome C oxidoreductase [Myxococcaceae bacterium]
MAHAIEKPTDITIPSTSLFAKLPMIGGVMAVVGLGATLGSAFGENKARAMYAYLFGFEVALTVALGSLAWLLINHLVKAGWHVVLRRIAEATVMALPVFALLFVPIAAIGFHELYPWSHEMDEILARKTWFLTPGFFFVRAALYFTIWSALAWVLHSNSTKMDDESDPSKRASMTGRLITVSAPGLALFALSSSFAAIDWVMGLQPHWYSTIFGVYFFAVSMLSFNAFLALVSMGLQKAGVLKTAITTEHFHDLGKYVYGYGVFWAYIAFSQFILIWYANIPEETEFYIMRTQGGWQYVSYALPVLHFFVPFFFLLSRHVKRSRLGLAIGCAWMLVMHVVDLYWLIMPNAGLHGGGEGHHEPHLAVSYLDVTALIGFVGVFLALFGFWLNRHKVVAINDPRLGESLAHENY